MKTDANSGFSLVELSIVLVILGLLVGGILGGQSLIRAAELRSVTTELQQWQTAVNTFRQKYNGFPGDFAQATRFWGDTYSPASPPTGKETRSGNGDGFISESEMFLHWQHLSNAGLVSGSFELYEYYGGHAPVVGTHMPASKAGGTWLVMAGREGQNMWVLAQGIGNDGTFAWPLPMLAPEELWSIDSKMDDGLALTGTIQAAKRGDNCLATVDGEENYNLGSNASPCIAGFAYDNSARGWPSFGTDGTGNGSWQLMPL